jgi:diguanylate cyclase (GGDEF)-like protein/PAS domain S-box-containing protein
MNFQKAIRANGDHFRFIFDNAPQGIYLLTPDWKFLTVNPAMANILGYGVPSDLVASLTDLDRQYYASPERSADFKELITERGLIRDFEARVFRKDGSIIWVSTSARAIRDPKGELLYVEGLVTDITEVKLIEESSKELEEQNRLLIQNSNDAIFIAQDGVIKFANPKTEELFGYSAAEMAKIPFADYIHPDDKGMVLERNRRRLEGQRIPTTYPFRIINRSGQESCIEINAVVIEWGKRPATLVIARNLTEERKKEVELGKAHSMYRAILGNINDIVLSLDDKGCLTYINPVVEKKLSFQTKEMIGKPLSSFIHPHAEPDFRDNIKRCLAGTQKAFEFQILDKKNQIFHMRFSGRPLIKDGQTIGLTGILIDITEQELSETLLKRAERNYRSIFENALEGIFQSTIDGHFLVANPACARILGYSSPEELITRHLIPHRPFYLNPEIRKEFQNLLQEVGVVKGFEYEVYRKDGRKIWVSENALAMRDSNGNVLFYEGTLQDITDKKLAEDKIRYLSFYDSLTGVYNRAFFEENLRRMDSPRQLPISILMGDANGLKLINDAFGHQEGDRFLKEIADILKGCCRKEDMVARLGGDEFAILLPRTNHGVSMEITERIKKICKEKSRAPFEVSMALGVATKDDPLKSIEVVLKEAEDRMYRNKLLESKSFRTSLLSSLRQTLFEKSHETEEHTRRLQRLALQIGNALRLPDSTLDELTLLASLHDIGKIAIPEEIIIKPDKLSSEEWELIRKHPEIGYRIANSSPEMVPVAEGILSHHEWWNGAGYPRMLFGKEIPLVSRIISVVDAYDVMIYGRPYKKALSKQEALEEIKRCAGSQFDPLISRILFKLLSGAKPGKFLTSGFVPDVL